MHARYSTITLLDYVLVTLLLCFSGNPVFVSVSQTRELYVGMFAFVVVLCLLKGRRDIFKRYAVYITFYFFLFLLQLLIVDASLSSILFFLMKLFIGCGVFLLLEDRFVDAYINVMFVIAAISIFFFVYILRLGFIPGVQTSDHTFSLYVYTELINAEEGLVRRNSGMFWEPGAFQGYLNIALFFLFSKSSLKLIDYIKAAVLAVSVFTTYSTTGYIVLALVFVYFVIRNKNIPGFVKVILLLVLATTFFYLYSSLYLLGEKVTGAVSVGGTEESRLTDHIRFSSLIAKHPFIGNSFIDDVFSGNGLVLHLVFVGFLGVFYYWMTLLYNYRKQLPVISVLFFLSIIALSLIGEVFIMYPMFLALPFLVLKTKNHDTKTIKTTLCEN